MTVCSLSTISITIGRSMESLKILAVWMRFECPEPIGPRSTVAPARCNSRAFKTTASIEVLPAETITFAPDYPQQDGVFRNLHGGPSLFVVFSYSPTRARHLPPKVRNVAETGCSLIGVGTTALPITAVNRIVY